MKGRPSFLYSSPLVCTVLTPIPEIAAHPSQADFVAGMLPPAAKFRALGDAGFFLDHLNMNGQQLIRPEFQNMFLMMNSSYGINDACVSGKSGYELRAPGPWLHLQAHFASDTHLCHSTPKTTRRSPGAVSLHSTRYPTSRRPFL